jgi:hypothetical protein
LTAVCVLFSSSSSSHILDCFFRSPPVFKFHLYFSPTNWCSFSFSLCVISKQMEDQWEKQSLQWVWEVQFKNRILPLHPMPIEVWYIFLNSEWKATGFCPSLSVLHWILKRNMHLFVFECDWPWDSQWIFSFFGFTIQHNKNWNKELIIDSKYLSNYRKLTRKWSNIANQEEILPIRELKDPIVTSLRIYQTLVHWRLQILHKMSIRPVRLKLRNLRPSPILQIICMHFPFLDPRRLSTTQSSQNMIMRDRYLFTSSASLKYQNLFLLIFFTIHKFVNVTKRSSFFCTSGRQRTFFQRRW